MDEASAPVSLLMGNSTFTFALASLAMPAVISSRARVSTVIMWWGLLGVGVGRKRDRNRGVKCLSSILRDASSDTEDRALVRLGGRPHCRRAAADGDRRARRPVDPLDAG